MKVLFSNPPWWVRQGAGWLAGVRAGSRWPFTYAGPAPDRPLPGEYLPYPLFLAHAASYAARHTQAPVVYRDSIALREGYEAFVRHLSAERYGAVLIESSGPSWAHDRVLVVALRRLLPETRFAIAGPVTAARAAEAAGVAGTALVGEYEKAAVRWLGGEEGVIGPDFLSGDELDRLPFPYLDAYYAGRYWDANPAGQAPPQLQAWSSRGCPYRCIFCVWPATMTGQDPDGQGRRQVRQHLPEYVAALAQDRQARFGVRAIYFDDDTFNLGDRHTLGMCQAMRRVGLPWAAMCRADTVSRDVWGEMQASGCVGVKIGFESGSQWVIDHIVGKRLDLAAAAETVRHIKSLGMSVHGTFTLGLPGETREQQAQTLAFLRSLPLDTHQVSGAAEIEGTPLSALRARGRLARYDGAVASGEIEQDGVQKLARLGAGA